MATITKNPLCDFRAVSSPAAGVKATATTTAPSQVTPIGTMTPVLVVQDITASIGCGTNATAPILVNLIDGTTGGTNIAWSTYLSAGTSAALSVAMSYLNIPCKSGYATLEFAAATGTLASQSVAMGGYFSGGYGN